MITCSSKVTLGANLLMRSSLSSSFILFITEWVFVQEANNQGHNLEDYNRFKLGNKNA